MEFRKILFIFTLIAKVVLKLMEEMRDLFDGDPQSDVPVESQPVGPFDVLNPDQKRDIAKARDECCQPPH